MRIVIVSQNFLAMRGMVRICRAAGHEPLAVLCARAASARGGRSSAGMVRESETIVATAPPGIDLAVVGDVDRLEALVHHYRPDLLLVRGFPWRLPQSLLAIAPYGSVNLHPSVLPRLRGPFPVHWAIRNGDRTLGATAHRMDGSFDTGPVLATATFDVPAEEFGAAIWMRVNRGAEAALGMALERVLGQVAGDRQSDPDATYAGPFAPDDGLIDWDRSARSIHNLVRAWSLGALGTEGPAAVVDGRMVRIRRTSTTPADALRVDCGDRPIWLVDYEPW
jgi:methionyl-tRNA formyltransferase